MFISPNLCYFDSRSLPFHRPLSLGASASMVIRCCPISSPVTVVSIVGSFSPFRFDFCIGPPPQKWNPLHSFLWPRSCSFSSVPHLLSSVFPLADLPPAFPPNTEENLGFPHCPVPFLLFPSLFLFGGLRPSFFSEQPGYSTKCGSLWRRRSPSFRQGATASLRDVSSSPYPRAFRTLAWHQILHCDSFPIAADGYSPSFFACTAPRSPIPPFSVPSPTGS